MPPRPSQKRAAESRNNDSNASKKTRFVEPTEDPSRFEEEVEATLEDSSRNRRKVKSAGYDSDSSDDGESVVRSRAGATGASATAQEDEDDDMFAISEKEPKDDAAQSAKRKEEYLRLGDIEGQEFNDAGGSANESEESDEPEDEDDAARRAKAGMGYELSSFNMREEMEEGKFTEDGSYVRSVDAHAQHDRWMEGTDECEMKRARRRKREREKQERARQDAEEQELADAGGKPALERDLLTMLKRGETVLEALQRLGAQAKRTEKLNKGKNKDTTKTPITKSTDPAAKSLNPIEHVTHMASMLMSLGNADVYSQTYEELVRSVRKSGSVPEDWDPPSADVKYEYMWDVPDSTAPGQVLGPYTDEEMKGWNSAGYFGVGANKIKIRAVGGEWGDWDDVIV